MREKSITLPMSHDVVSELRAGDEVALSGSAFLARDATLAKLKEVVALTGELPRYLRGQLVFFAGPTPSVAHHPFGAIGPTTARRMDDIQSELMPYGLTLSLGKGARSAQYRRSAKRYRALYFATVGGAAALMARQVTSAQVLAWPELGTEALSKVELSQLWAIVAIDSEGNDIYER